MECIYTVQQKRIKLNSLNDKINLWFFGDVHRDTKGCDVDRWIKFLKTAKETPDSYFFYMGDGNDFASTSEKKIIEDSKLHDTTREKFDDFAMRDIRRFCQEINFMQGRLLGCIEGNHSWVFIDGQKSDEIIAQRMDSVFLGWLSSFILTLEDNANHAMSLSLALCHGRAGGKRAGASINQVEDLRIQTFGNMDIYCFAHDHNRGAWPQITLVPSRGKNGDWTMKQKQYWLCRSGSFKKGYTPGTSGYEIGRLLRPSDIGALRLQIGVDRYRKNGDDVLFPEITAII